MTEEAIAATERWFRSRGVPHFIQDYNAREDILTRAIPFLVLTLLLEAFLFVNPDLPWWVNVLVVAFVLLLILGIWAGLNFVRGRRLLALPERVGLVEVGVYLFLPGSLAAILDLNWALFFFFLFFNAVILAVIFAVVSYGLGPIAIWALRLLIGRLWEVVGLFARALPLLLLVVTFLFINEEVWRVMARLDDGLLGGVVALFGLMGLLFLASRLPSEISDLEEFRSAERIRDLVRGTPVEAVALEEGALRLDIPLGKRQWLNAGLVVLVSLVLQVVFVSALLGIFFTIFGVIIVDDGVLLDWTGQLSDVLVRFDWLGNLVLTVAHVKVVTFLATFSAFYFTVSMVTNPEYRAEFFEDIVGDLRQALAVRTVYLSAIEQERDAADLEAAAGGQGGG